ncbi:MAG TPA: DUF1786 domain-containing protein [Anaerolineales bacterium]|nr:DUF1786 domain-containing protein [Anaerolineales bacterium]
MQILTVDVGTGTQDVFLFRSGLALENGFKLVMPSPTMILQRRIQQATARGEPLLLTGVTMGGGPSAWAAEAHCRAGLPLYATAAAARTFNDDLEGIQREMGVVLVSEDEAARLQNVTRLEMKDFDYPTLASAFSAFGIELEPAAVGVAVFDHGAAPPGISDRTFRFDYIERRIREENRLSAFAYRAADVPPFLTRLRSVVDSAGELSNLVVMDTAPAAVLGAGLDAMVRSRSRRLVVNVGNFHALAFRLGPGGVEAVFEHHTGELTTESLEHYLEQLAAGTITRQSVFDDMGHGALVFDPTPLRLDEGPFGIVVTGPRREKLAGSRLRPYFAVPAGDMMSAGCFGLLLALADLLPEVAQAIHSVIGGAHDATPPWEAG